jgi:hypothetical protein
MIALCVYSHSEYFDVLKVQMDYILSLNVPCDIYLFVNTPFNFSGGKRTTCKSVKRRYRTRKRLRGGNMEKVKTIIYDDKVPYFQRLSSCIAQVNSTHIILTQDNDILLKVDMDAINKMVDLMNKNNIDSIKLSGYTYVKPELHVKDSLYISTVVDDGFVYSVNPRLWRKESALKLYLKFPDKTYKSSENEDVQKFSKTQKTYVMYDTHIIKSQYSSTKYYTYIHITGDGKIYEYDKKKDVDPIMISEYTKIKNKYFKNTKRLFHV